MLTREDIRKAALAMPEAYEAAHFETSSFRVNKKIFCVIHEDRPRAVLKLDPEDQHNLADGDAIQPVEGSWGRRGCTYLYYERLARDRFDQLLRLAWATVAPKRLLK